MHKNMYMFDRYKMAALVCLTGKNQSVSQLAGGKMSRTSFQRSEEVGAAADMRSRVMRQPSKESTDGSLGSISSDSSCV